MKQIVIQIMYLNKKNMKILKKQTRIPKNAKMKTEPNQITKNATIIKRQRRKEPVNDQEMEMNGEEIKSTSLRNSGKNYKNWKNNLVSARKIKGPCTCILKWSTKFSEENRKVVFDQYWGVGSIDRQRDFISKHVKFVPKWRCRLRADKNEEIAVNSRRNYTYIYNLRI
ncbi:unnamed protein product [Psylliodes chrysocephalus]|uniref:Uncharacterized protein n=1 Tax=Psylliodes chrysocephalus TaxID=3402493 RepID=A0A9P0CKZ1_9CUCU|nr:unnamed protein product [Psylliodes chrysocephala]